MAIKWQDILKYSAGGFIGSMFLIVLLLNLTGMHYTDDGDKSCYPDCYSKVEVNSTYWNICAEHAGETKEVVFRKSTSPVLWVNLDKISSVAPTQPNIQTEILVPATKASSTVKSEQYGYLRPLKDGDCFIKRVTKSNPNPSKIYIHGVKTEDVDVKWSFLISDWLSEDILIDPVWYGTQTSTETSNLIAHYKFDGDFEDSSSSNNDGTQSGGVQIGQGVKGKGAVFDGVNDIVNITNAMSNYSQITISSWVKFDTGGYQHIWAGETSIFRLFWNASAVPNNFYIVFPKNVTSYVGDYTGSETVETNRWYNLVATDNGTQVNFYQNGVNIYSGSFALHNITAGGMNFIIGCRPSVSNCFDGTIDEVRIYNTSLSASEVYALYNSNKTAYFELNTAPTQGITDETGLVGYWTMDSKDGCNSATCPDKSGLGNTGTVSGATFTNEGKFKEAYSFVTNDAISVANSSTTNFGTENFSISLWMKSGDTTANKVLIEKKTAGTFGTTTGWFVRNSLIGIDSSNYKSVIINANILDNNWHNIIAVFNKAENLTVYIDGLQDNTVTITGVGTVTNDVAMGIGARVVVSDLYFNGSIDEVRIYNRSLSSSEIAGLYNGAKTYYLNMNTAPTLGITDETKLVGYWKMDAGTGSNSATAVDSGGQGNTGTVTGATFTNEGRFKEAYVFDGSNDYINIPNNEGLDFDTTENLSITAWIKPAFIPSATARVGIVSKRAIGTTNYWQFTVDNTNKLEMYLSNGITPFPAVNDIGTVSANGNWYFISTTIAKGETNGFKLYIDGVQKDQNTVNANFNLSNNINVTIGWEQSNNKYFNGTIDEVRIYNRTLSSTEIGQLYNGTKTYYLNMNTVAG